jgi:hypothetical protein
MIEVANKKKQEEDMEKQKWHAIDGGSSPWRSVSAADG